MALSAMETLKTELCTRIGDLVLALQHAEEAAQKGEFEASADILQSVVEKAGIAAQAARTSDRQANPTPWTDLKRPILEALDREGGTARIWQVFQYLEDHLRLTLGDKDQHVADTRETEWQHECRVAANAMRNDPLNYLEPVNVPGVWSLTHAGREHLQELRRSDGLANQ